MASQDTKNYLAEAEGPTYCTATEVRGALLAFIPELSKAARQATRYVEQLRLAAVTEEDKRISQLFEQAVQKNEAISRITTELSREAGQLTRVLSEVTELEKAIADSPNHA